MELGFVTKGINCLFSLLTCYSSPSITKSLKLNVSLFYQIFYFLQFSLLMQTLSLSPKRSRANHVHKNSKKRPSSSHLQALMNLFLEGQNIIINEQNGLPFMLSTH